MHYDLSKFRDNHTENAKVIRGTYKLLPPSAHPIWLKNYTKGGFPVIAEISRNHVSTKEINHANTRSQHSEGNFYCKNCLRAFSTMTGIPV